MEILVIALAALGCGFLGQALANRVPVLNSGERQELKRLRLNKKHADAVIAAIAYRDRQGLPPVNTELGELMDDYLKQNGITLKKELEF